MIIMACIGSAQASGKAVLSVVWFEKIKMSLNTTYAKGVWIRRQQQQQATVFFFHGMEHMRFIRHVILENVWAELCSSWNSRVLVSTTLCCD
jgi:hypothetical protein